MNDPLIEAILVAPNDDAPRLVWADREGGERGELVVVQCALARGEYNDRLRARATELLAAHARAWSGLPPLGDADVEPMFVRGFMEGLRTNLDVLAEHGPALFARTPFLRVLLVDDQSRHAERRREEVLNAALASLVGLRLRALSISPVLVDLRRDAGELVQKLTKIASLASLESLRMPVSGVRAVESLSPLRVLPHLKSIVIHEARIEAERCRPIFDILPQLESIRVNRVELRRRDEDP